MLIERMILSPERPSAGQTVPVEEPGVGSFGFGIALSVIGVAFVGLLVAGLLVVVIRRTGSHRPRPVGSRKRPGPITEAEQDTLVAAEPMICVLGPIDVIGGGWGLTPQQLSLVTFLACSAKATRESIIDALWDGRAVSHGRFSNLLAETRSKIGRHHLPEAERGLYRLVGTTTDLARFERLVAAAEDRPEEADRLLGEALALVHGVPFLAPPGQHWAWISTRTDRTCGAELLVTTTAARLAGRRRSTGDLAGARRAYEAGLQAAPLDEELTGGLVEVMIAQGMTSSADRLVDSWEDRIRRLGCGEPPPVMRQCLAAALGPHRPGTGSAVAGRPDHRPSGRWS